MIEENKLEAIEKEQRKREFIYRNKIRIKKLFGDEKYEQLMREEAKAMDKLFRDILD